MIISRLLAAVVGALVAFAGANKLTDRPAWRAAARAQGVPAPVAAILPAVELLLGVCLVVLPLNALALGATTALLVIFTVFLCVQVATRSTVPCACFGARSATPPQWRDVVRNLAMIGALVLAAAIG